MPENEADRLYLTIKKALLYATTLVIIVWISYKFLSVILLLLLALILVVIINSPVGWLEKKNIKRGWACAIVFGAIAIVSALLIWLVFPTISFQLGSLVSNLPQYATQLSTNVASWFENYPEISKQIKADGGSLAKWVPSFQKTLLQIGNYSLSVIAAIFILIIFFTMVIYAVANPRPLLEVYFSFFSASSRIKAERALINTSIMLIGWMRANLIGGTIAAILVTTFLTIMHVPGAWVWGALALFAELIPRIGFYIMSIPPILVALSISPMTALWVLIFYLALDEILGDFIMPRLRSKTMNIHPVASIFLLLAMGTAFGLIGALLATPMAAIIKAYYEEFYLVGLKEDKETAKRIDDVLYHSNAKGRLSGKNK